jgi:hypothetical protein
MKRKQLPDFATPSTRQLRELWRKYPDDVAVHNACLEMERMREVFMEIEAYRRGGAVLAGGNAQNAGRAGKAAHADGARAVTPGD